MSRRKQAKPNRLQDEEGGMTQNMDEGKQKLNITLHASINICNETIINVLSELNSILVFFKLCSAVWNKRTKRF
jgi:hypothetical protein